MTIFRFIGYGSGSAGGVGSEFLWNANGDLVAYDPQPIGGFNGMLQDNLALSGPGPFDGQRIAYKPSFISGFRVIQRSPGSSPSVTGVEFYRIRGSYPGIVTSLGIVSFLNGQQFQSASGVVNPGTEDIAVGDIFFVAFESVPGLDAADLTAFLELVP